MSDSTPKPTFTPEEIEALYFNVARQGDTELLAEFIRAGMDINHQNQEGHTALILACYHNHLEAVELLLEKGADPNIVDNKGATALTGVAFKGYIPIAKLLVNAGAKIDSENNLKRTALMFAILFGRNDMAQFLIESGANPHHTDGEGVTPIQLAERQGDAELINLLKSQN
ncbi:ankyrin repeat domain-containing protein [Commensalibacter nepenthis]|uniref:Ankyrin repeat domain-containing protein n=1 Tax=Commensalibacter nepenthis TaxID=3043872 RepID=A0ABT6Q7I5_9PROT|nr:ankyrin repeat domain-containing protein [Commensalibacter sp. TBRC 10068]MDI2112846.1 ankyrin repeat domain-containing protein [Commensalibacter sp. TBRC 10068]